MGGRKLDRLAILVMNAALLGLLIGAVAGIGHMPGNPILGGIAGGCIGAAMAPGMLFAFLLSGGDEG